jgi:hypothetical protein
MAGRMEMNATLPPYNLIVFNAYFEVYSPGVFTRGGGYYIFPRSRCPLAVLYRRCEN